MFFLFWGKGVSSLDSFFQSEREDEDVIGYDHLTVHVSYDVNCFLEDVIDLDARVAQKVYKRPNGSVFFFGHFKTLSFELFYSIHQLLDWEIID